jgi:Tfp pilus assembly protein PilO
MENTFYSLQEFMLHTKGVVYILMGVMILGILGFWLYLNGRDEDRDLK